MHFNQILMLFVINLFLLTNPASATIEGYYKDVFSDGGCRLGCEKPLPAAQLLDLSVEYLNTADEELQNNVMIISKNGKWKDSNGVLLYPDGSPRFRCLFTNGGKSIPHGKSLGEKGRQRIREFFAKGGSYTGSCAGSAIATIRTTTSKRNRSHREEYYHIWPARADYTQLAKSHTDMEIPKSSPLLEYYDFGGDFRIEQVRHNAGNFVMENDNFWWCKGTDVLATYAEPLVGKDEKYRDFLGHVSAWAYKANPHSGRLAVCGSHPESVENGEIRDFQAAMILYAMEGNGSPKVKATLSNRVPREMNDNHARNHEKIGDLQYHHFKIEVPKGVKELRVNVAGPKDVDMNVYLKRSDFAFKGDGGVIEARHSRSSRERIIVDNPKAGSWFVGVKCNEAVTGKQKRQYFEYTENLRLLNGVPYTVTAAWSE